VAARVLTASLVETITDDMRSRILGGGCPGETTFTETGVATRYEVARPTARVAIEKLVSEAVLERPMSKTARLIKLGPDDVRDIYFTRARLEKAVLLQLAQARSVPPKA
jgi:DNA-binding GntR family transcriptional regulator